MKLVVALIRPEQVPAVKMALHDAGIDKLTATTVMGTAPRTEQRKYRGVEQRVSLFRRVRMEVAANDSDVEKVIDTLLVASGDLRSAARAVAPSRHVRVRSLA